MAIKNIDRKIIKDLIANIDNTIPHPCNGSLARSIWKYDYYREKGYEFIMEDLVYALEFAHLTILSKDMINFLSNNHQMNDNIFKQVINEVTTEECALYGDHAFPDYHPDLYKEFGLSGLPKCLGENGDFEGILEPGPNIVHEWTVKPGKKIFITFFSLLDNDFKRSVCGKDGLCRSFENKENSRKKLIEEIVIKIINICSLENPFWHPFIVYLSYLLVGGRFDNTDISRLKNFCRGAKYMTKSKTIPN